MLSRWFSLWRAHGPDQHDRPPVTALSARPGLAAPFRRPIRRHLALTTTTEPVVALRELCDQIEQDTHALSVELQREGRASGPPPAGAG